MSFEIKKNTIYSLKELSEGLNITIVTLRKWIKSGQLKASKLGRDYKVKGESIEKLLKDNMVEPTIKKN